MMDEQKPQTENSTAPEATSTVPDAGSQEPIPESPTNPQSAEDSREVETMKAEATAAVESIQTPPSDDSWLTELKRFNGVVNETLASKENLTLMATNIKVRPEFTREWTLESNRFRLLLVNLRRRGLHQSSRAQKKGNAA